MASALAGAGVRYALAKRRPPVRLLGPQKSPAEPGRAMTAGLIGAPGLGGKNRRTRQSNTTNARLLGAPKRRPVPARLRRRARGGKRESDRLGCEGAATEPLPRGFRPRPDEESARGPANRKDRAKFRAGTAPFPAGYESATRRDAQHLHARMRPLTALTLAGRLVLPSSRSVALTEAVLWRCGSPSSRRLSLPAV
jgi:hypothetical protein